MLLYFATRINDLMYRWKNQKHLKTHNCNLCDKKEDIIHLVISCKRNKKIWKHFEKYYKCLTQKEHTLLQHILTHSATSLPSKIKKLVLTLTTTILTHIWKTRNRLQFHDFITPTTNTTINIKNDWKNIIQTNYKQHTINNTLPDFEINFCINNALYTIKQNSLTPLL